MSMNGFMSYQTSCRKCNGSGSVIKDPCQGCFGTGTNTKTEELEIDIPPGVGDGMEMRIPNKGQAGSKGGGAGSLFINFRVEQSPDFTRDGADVYSTASISVAQALLGGTVPVKGIMSDMNLKVRAGTASGKRSRLRGRGMPRVQ
jgi:molecular chaperone DnaJ